MYENVRAKRFIEIPNAGGIAGGLKFSNGNVLTRPYPVAPGPNYNLTSVGTPGLGAEWLPSPALSSVVYIIWGPETGSGFIGNSELVINRAMASLPDLKGTIYLGPGLYTLSGLILSNYVDVKFIGLGGATITSNFLYMIVLNTVSPSSLLLEDLNFEVAGDIGVFNKTVSTATDQVVHINRCVFTTVSDSGGFLFDDGADLNDSCFVQVTDCIFDSTSQTTLTAIFQGFSQNMSNWSFTNCSFRMSEFSSILASGDPSLPVRFANCVFEGGQVGGLPPLPNYLCSQFSNCQFVDTAVHVLAHADTGYFKAVGCTFDKSSGEIFTILNPPPVDSYIANLVTTACAFNGDVLGFSGVDATHPLDLTLNVVGCTDDFIGDTSISDLTVNSASVIELPQTNRSYATLALLVVPTYTSALSNDNGMVRFNGTTWVQQNIVNLAPAVGGTGVAGQVTWGEDTGVRYLYVCIATDTWERIAIATY